MTTGPLEDPSGAHLLVRDAQPADQTVVAALLGEAGWTGDEGRTDGASTVVLYDPADGIVRGAVAAGPVADGSFRLLAWAVHDVLDHAAMTSTRLLRAAADRLRRSGAERLVATLHVPATVEIFTKAGFGVVRSEPGSDRVMLYQEL